MFIIGTNDAQVYDDRDAAKYEQLTEQMMRILVGDGREVYWVNAPVMKDDDLEENVVKVDAIQRRVADRVEGVTFVDAHTLFADEAGEYQSSLADETGDEVSMRAGDGIHLTGDGAEHLARAIFAPARPDAGASASSRCSGQTKKVIVSEDSDSGYGGGGSGSSSDWDSSGSQSWNSSGSGSGSEQPDDDDTRRAARPRRPPLRPLRRPRPRPNPRWRRRLRPRRRPSRRRPARRFRHPRR